MPRTKAMRPMHEYMLAYFLYFRGKIATSSLNMPLSLSSLPRGRLLHAPQQQSISQPCEK